MKPLRVSKQFQKDLKLAIKRQKQIKKLQIVLDILVASQILPPRYRPHKLSGRYTGLWECHIEPDWLLIYSIEPQEIGLVRLGTHVDLFN
jgi:mRNA interferase YafQ